MKRIKAVLLPLFFLSITLYAKGPADGINKKIDQFSLHLDTNPHLAFYYINSAYRESKAIKNDSLIARCLCNLGYYYYTQYNVPEARKKSFQAVEMAKKTKYFKVLSSSYNQLGMIAADAGRYDESLSWYLNALKITDAISIPNIRSRVLTNLGYLCLIQKDTARSLAYYQESIANAEKHNLFKELAVGYETVGVLYSVKDKQKSEESFRKALVIVKQNKDLYTEFRLYIDLSDLYLKAGSYKDPDKALEVLRQATKIQQATKDESLLFYVNFNLAAYYLSKKQYDQSLGYYNKALALSKKNINSDQILNLYKALSDTYICKKNYKNALLYKEHYNNLKDSVFDIEKNKSFNEIQTKYGVYKKNARIALLTKNQEIQKNRKQTILFVGLVLLGLLLIIVFFLRHRINTQRVINLKENKIHRQEIIRLEQEQELKRINGILEGQGLERNRLAQEIHDGIGGSLAGIKLQLSQANTKLRDEKIDAIVNQIGAAFNELRSISHNLSFNFLKDKNLERMLHQLKIDYEERIEFKMEICVFPENALDMLPDSIKHQVYRIVQELITNVSRHANAQQVLLNFTKHDELLNIIVEDDGVGFVVGSAQGIGFKNIHERLSALNGTIIIESVVGNGTTILIDIPMHEN